ncbi:MAG: helix-turn-helix domain-containing protein, partial [Candidatus Rokubacteria bacterium]|nr:helix-turn-helix domain-containing protein [Candidatus Rokubacteria bacterium]
YFDIRSTVLIVVGYGILPEEEDRPIACELKRIINSRGEGTESRSAVVVTGMWMLNEVILPRTRDDVAAHIGTVRELVSRSLARMQREGLLALRGRRVVLLDMGRLAALAGREGG